jgi:hypothetical protein
VPPDLRRRGHHQDSGARISIHGPSDALPEGRLPTPGGPTKHKIGLFPWGTSLRTARNSTIRFYSLQIVMIGIENFARLGRSIAPRWKYSRQLHHPIEISPQG